MVKFLNNLLYCKLRNGKVINRSTISGGIQKSRNLCLHKPNIISKQISKQTVSKQAGKIQRSE